MYEMLKNYRWSLIAVAVTFALYAYFCGVSDNGGGAGDVGAELDTTVRNQSDITSRIDGIEEGVDDIEGGINRSAEAVGRAEERALRIEGSLDEAGRLIAECQRIVESVRARGEANGAET